jgi:hypothetical protein
MAGFLNGDLCVLIGKTPNEIGYELLKHSPSGDGSHVELVFDQQEREYLQAQAGTERSVQEFLLEAMQVAAGGALAEGLTPLCIAGELLMWRFWTACLRSIDTY